jgi:hypothetical protein
LDRGDNSVDIGMAIGSTCGRTGVNAGSDTEIAVLSGVNGGSANEPLKWPPGMGDGAAELEPNDGNTGRLASFLTLSVAMGVGAGVVGKPWPFLRCWKNPASAPLALLVGFPFVFISYSWDDSSQLSVSVMERRGLCSSS